MMKKGERQGCDCEEKRNFTEKGVVDYLHRDFEAPVSDIAAQRLEEWRENPPLLQPARGRQSNWERRKGAFTTPAVPPGRVGPDRTRQRSNWRWGWGYIGPGPVRTPATAPNEGKPFPDVGQSSILKSSTPIKCHFSRPIFFSLLEALHKNVLCKVFTSHNEGLPKNWLSQKINCCNLQIET